MMMMSRRGKTGNEGPQSIFCRCAAARLLGAARERSSSQAISLSCISRHPQEAKSISTEPGQRLFCAVCLWSFTTRFLGSSGAVLALCGRPSRLRPLHCRRWAGLINPTCGASPSPIHTPQRPSTSLFINQYGSFDCFSEAHHGNKERILDCRCSIEKPRGDSHCNQARTCRCGQDQH